MPEVRKAAMFAVRKVFENGKSKIEKLLFNDIKELFIDAKENMIIESNNKLLFPDIIIDNIIIEFYGDYWHMNPKKYNVDDINKNTQLSAKTIWQKDRKRNFYLQSLGFIVLIAWEDDYRNNKNEQINYLATKVKQYRAHSFSPCNAVITEHSQENK